MSGYIKGFPGGLLMLAMIFALVALPCATFLESTCASAEPGWVEQTTLPYGVDLWDISAADTSTAWVTGAEHTLMKTADGGITWEDKGDASLQPLYYNGICAVDADTAWLLAYGGIILKTTDGGSSWVDQSPATEKEMSAIDAVDSTTAWVVGSAGTILKTTDGGSTWLEQNSGTSFDLISVSAIDAETAWASGHYGQVLKTTDGGSTWTVYELQGVEYTLREIAAVDAEIAWVVDDYHAFRTGDGGSTWERYTPGTVNITRGIAALDGSNAWVVGTSGICRTTDGGQTWTPQDPGTSYELSNIIALDANNLWVVGSYGTILRTGDAGNSWVVQRTSTLYMTDVSCVDRETAWAVGHHGIIVKTTDGGATWAVQDSGTDQNLLGVCAVDRETAWAVGNRGTILRTTDKGATWLSLNTDIYDRIYVEDISALDANTAWVTVNIITSPYYSVIWKTTDGGTSWDTQYFANTPNRLLAVGAVDTNTVWAAGGNLSPLPVTAPPYNTIIESGDGGMTWTARYSNEAAGIKPFSAMAVVDADIVWALNEDYIVKTSDGGSTWEELEPDVLYQKDISACDANTAWVVGSDGVIKKTVDGGITWEQQATPTSKLLDAVCALDTATVWAVGFRGVIVKTEDGGDARPDIVSLIPSLGTAGTELTVLGCDFGDERGTSYVSIGGMQASEYISWSDNQVKVRVPAGIAGEIAVTVTTPEGTSNPLSFWYQEKLSVTSVNPSQGTQYAFAMNIEVAGTGFQTGAMVRLEKGEAALQAYSVNVLSNMKITCTVGLFGVEPGAYDVVVTGLDGQEARLEDAFTVTSACGAGSGTALLMLGLTLGLLSLAGSVGIRRRKKRG